MANQAVQRSLLPATVPAKQKNECRVVVYYCGFTINTYAPVTPKLLHVTRRSRAISNKASVDELFSLLQPDSQSSEEDCKEGKPIQAKVDTNLGNRKFSTLVTRLIVDRPGQPQLLVDQKGNVVWDQRKFHINPARVDRFLTKLFAKH